MEVLQYLLVPFTNPILLVFVAVGCFAGIYIGAIPGLSATMAVSLLVSFTFGWETQSAIALMIGIFVGAVYGGSRSAILLNIPGNGNCHDTVRYRNADRCCGTGLLCSAGIEAGVKVFLC